MNLQLLWYYSQGWVTLRAHFIASYNNMSCNRLVDVRYVHFLKEVIKCNIVDEYVVCCCCCYTPRFSLRTWSTVWQYSWISCILHNCLSQANGVFERWFSASNLVVEFMPKSSERSGQYYSIGRQPNIELSMHLVISWCEVLRFRNIPVHHDD